MGIHNWDKMDKIWNTKKLPLAHHTRTGTWMKKNTEAWAGGNGINIRHRRKQKMNGHTSDRRCPALPGVEGSGDHALCRLGKVCRIVW